MADSNDRNKAVQYELAQDDPFAELTRIMGHDPRGVLPLKPVAPEPADDLALDLENELMGHLNGEGDTGDAGQDPEMASWQQEFAEPQFEPAEAGAPDGQPEFESALEALLQETVSESEQLGGYPDHPAADERDYFTAGEPVHPEVNHDEADVFADSAFAPQVEKAPADSDFSAQPGDYSDYSAADKPDYFTAGEPDYSAAGENEAAGFADPSFAPQAEGAAQDTDFSGYEAPSELEFAEPEFSGFEHEATGAIPEPVELSEPDALPEPVEFAAPEDAGNDSFAEEQQAYQPELEDFAIPEEAFEFPEDVSLARENEAAAASSDDFAGEPQELEGSAGGEWAFTDWPEVPSNSQDAFGTQSHQPWNHAQDEPVQSQSPEEASSPAAPEQHYEEAWPPIIDTVEVPEDTVAIADNLDIPEVSYREEVKPAAQFDEIEEILAGAFGETDLSGDVWAETAPIDEQAANEEPPAREDDFVDDYLAAGIAAAAGFGTAAAAYARAEDSLGEYNTGERWASPEGAIPPLAPQPGTEPPPGPRSRFFGSPMLMAVGVLAAVVLLGGGATLLAFSLSGDDAEPVVIAADNSPIKVRPENPGGIQIPNQDNQVYRRVSGEEVPDARPAQAELIETTEEPVELTPPPGVREANLRFPSEEEQQEAPQMSEEAQVPEAPTSQGAKIAERLTPDAGVEESAPQQDITALAPRRVRSMVVRPDGTIVPREMPEPAEAAAAAEDMGAAGADAQADGGQQVAAAAAGARDSAEPAESAAATVPAQGPIPPSRPGIATAPSQQRAPQAADAGRQTQQQASQQVAAVANPPAQVTAAPSSEWSVQIASQPTVEGAQQSYQQLAQRFGSMLQGRGVNIVQAEIEGRGTYYRVRIPSSSKEDAIALCEQLKSAGGNCFVSQ